MEAWKVWGDGTDPLFEGNEEEARLYYLDHRDNTNIYVESPDGDDLVWSDLLEAWVDAG